jgi:FkbH-like protein
MMSSTIKCVVWDLDNTLWDGICLEEEVDLRPHSRRVLEELDNRGILNSIASRGVEDLSIKVLKRYGLEKYFLAPKINWLPKFMNIKAISGDLGVSLDAMAFVDDDVFEREQIAFMLPDVMVFEDQCIPDLPSWPEFSPGELTREARSRRKFYMADEERQKAELQFDDRIDFLKWCDLQLTVRPMEETDIPRVMELMSRTHQLNTTGRILPRESLLHTLSCKSGDRDIHVADLQDRFSSYGTVGVAIVDRTPVLWRLSYLAVSCRVLGRGVERAFFSTLLKKAVEQGFTHVEAEFRDTGRNREMRVLYQMMGFKEASVRDEGLTILAGVVQELPEIPPWITLS